MWVKAVYSIVLLILSYCFYFYVIAKERYTMRVCKLTYPHFYFNFYKLIIIIT